MTGRYARSESGFTLVELLAALFLMAILMTLGVTSLRSYWLAQGLERSRDEIVTQLRNAQQRTISESHPVVFGLRVEDDSNIWGLVRYDPRRTTNRCVEVERHNFEAGVEVRSSLAAIAAAPHSECSAALGGGTFIFFFARGSATEGTIELASEYTDYARLIFVSGVTGRVTSPS